MTPIEVTVKTLAEHSLFETGDGESECGCGWTGNPEINDQNEAIQDYAAHMAAMLAAAGVVMGVQEWGVQSLTAVDLRVYVSEDRADAERAALTWPAELKTRVVSRFTGATAWAAEEETK